MFHCSYKQSIIDSLLTNDFECVLDAVLRDLVGRRALEGVAVEAEHIEGLLRRDHALTSGGGINIIVVWTKGLKVIGRHKH